jgi:hypothetical protein
LHQVGAGRQARLGIDRLRGRDHGRALPRPLDAIGDGRDQVARSDGLGQEIIGAAFEHFVFALGIGIAGQEHDGQVQEIGALANLHGQRHAVPSRHVQVHQHQIGLETFDCRQHRIGRHFHFGLHARAVQHALGEKRLAAVVLDDKDPERRFASIVLAAVIGIG